ncbi:divergent PAP2 family protein [Alicyclobacillus acidoterrestris]|uniref:Divergent PAP2 family protein n=1 Tax=Alicyclobacillus acidoterrestris (strain ATCC 49025 / DSM 3922 / CIP 106132 / NCIMB 13137 / GD3B) TaxID=1356854 RepID=A0A9E7CXU2_ALIAG|nr:divergent PAP2 family protein [Alicyclobacillus acidoterrestris]UNO48381.1 divergent PAP2 family protein [Alicyclobacillus acidoterrestris]
MSNAGGFVLVASFMSMFLAQFAKVVLVRIRQKSWQWHQFTNSGGMPSSHSSLMTTLTVCMWLLFGWKSPWFAIAFVSSVVVMYDAIGVRRQAGEQAMILDELMSQIHNAGVEIDLSVFDRFRHWKRQGHTPREVAGGIIVGIVVAFIAYKFF